MTVLSCLLSSFRSFLSFILSFVPSIRICDQISSDTHALMCVCVYVDARAPLCIELGRGTKYIYMLAYEEESKKYFKLQDILPQKYARLLSLLKLRVLRFSLS